MIYSSEKQRNLILLFKINFSIQTNYKGKCKIHMTNIKYVQSLKL